MSWKAKAHALALLSRLPGGRQMYHALQRMAGTNRLQLRRDLDRAYELITLTHQARGRIDGASCLEIGTGWRPLIPFVLALAGARQVITIDVNPWLTLDYALETWRALKDQLDEIAAVAQLDEQTVLRRYQAVPARPAVLSDLFDPLGIHYVYPGDARATGLADQSIDLIVSSNVLEHIPAEVLEEIHRESFRVLRRDGLSVHRFNPQDHYATVDSSITHANFLQYSTQAWHWYGGSGLAYHNRLRAPDYRRLFTAAGFELEICRERVDQRSLEHLQSGKLQAHPEFQGYSFAELAVDYMWVAGRKPASTEARPSAGPALPALQPMV